VQQLTVLFAGPQGSGKDTQVELLKKNLEAHDTHKVVHFDAGNALRAFAAKGGYTQDIVKASLARGELQPMFILADVMSEFFINSISGGEHLLISGFPRREDQLMLFRSAMSFYKRENPTLLFLSIPESESIARALKRGRPDDSEESVRKRLKWTHEETLPVVEAFRADPAYTYIEIDGTGTIEETHAKVLSALKLA
jgi:adenylate kinase